MREGEAQKRDNTQFPLLVYRPKLDPGSIYKKHVKTQQSSNSYLVAPLLSWFLYPSLINLFNY